MLPDGTPTNLNTLLPDESTKAEHLGNEEPISESGDTTLDAIELPNDISESLNNSQVEIPIVDHSEPLDSSSVKSVNLNDNSLELDKSESDNNKTKKANLKSCIIRLTELSSEERNKWMQKRETIDKPEGDSTSPLAPRYYMRARPESSNLWPKRSKRKPTNYSDNPKTDKDMDSDYKPILPGPPPLDNKCFPSANRIAMQQEILNNKTNKRGCSPSLTDETGYSPPKKPKQSNNNGGAPSTSNPKNNDSISAVNQNSANKDSNPTNKEPNTEISKTPPETSPPSSVVEDIKPTKGVFKTKRITIRCSKDPRSFKCSQCDHRMTSLLELNRHFIATHRKVQCDICNKSFNTPAAMRKHHYTHMEEDSQFKCRSCEKMFPFESQLKSHRHMHQRGRNYMCASAICTKSFKHPGDLAAHAKSHETTHRCAHCSYTNSDCHNLKSHLRTHSRDTPFKCKLCDARFVHSNQLVRHHSKCPKNIMAETESEAE